MPSVGVCVRLGPVHISVHVAQQGYMMQSECVFAKLDFAHAHRHALFEFKEPTKVLYSGEVQVLEIS